MSWPGYVLQKLWGRFMAFYMGKVYALKMGAREPLFDPKKDFRVRRINVLYIYALMIGF